MPDIRYRDPEYMKKWRAANPQKVREYNARRPARDQRAYHRARYAANRTERQERQREWGATHRASTRAYHLTRAYGIGAAAYDRLLAAQAGGCAICGTAPTDRPLHVDHDHKTGVVRGLLCDKHNRGLGNFQDNPALLRAAAKYLEER